MFRDGWSRCAAPGGSVRRRRFWIIPAASSPANTTATNTTRPISVRTPSPPAALEVALREEIGLEILVELHVGGLDDRPRPGAGRLREDVIGHGDLAARADVGLRAPPLRIL